MGFDTEQDPAAKPVNDLMNRYNLAGRGEIERKEILDSYRNSRILPGLSYLSPKDRVTATFTGFGKQFSAEITYVNNESHLGQLLKGGQYKFIILDGGNGQSDYTCLFGSLCRFFEKYRSKDKSFPVSVIDETDKMRKGLLGFGESFGLKVVFGTRKGNTIDTNLAKILEKN